MQTLSPLHKCLIQLAVFVCLLLLSLHAHLPIIMFLDNTFYLDFKQLMFLFGIVSGLFYHTINITCTLLQKHRQLTPSLQYLCSILPTTFVLNCFTWYFLLFFNRIFSDSKEDSQYFQTLIIAFSIYFLTIKIGKERNSLIKTYHHF